MSKHSSSFSYTLQIIYSELHKVVCSRTIASLCIRSTCVRTRWRIYVRDGETTRCVSYDEEPGDWSLAGRTSEPRCKRPKKAKCVKIVDLDQQRHREPNRAISHVSKNISVRLTPSAINQLVHGRVLSS